MQNSSIQSETQCRDVSFSAELELGIDTLAWNVSLKRPDGLLILPN